MRIIGLGFLVALVAAAPAQALDVARVTVKSAPAGVDCTATLYTDESGLNVFYPSLPVVRGDETECVTPLGRCVDDFKPFWEEPVFDYYSERGCDLSFADVAVECTEWESGTYTIEGEGRRTCAIS